jgi:hypothetical protein
MSSSSSSRRTQPPTTLPLHHHHTPGDDEFALRPIPEDGSDIGGSSLAGSTSLNYPQPLTRQQLSLTTTVTPSRPNTSGSVASSTKAVQAGHAGSVISDAAAVLADSDHADGTGRRVGAGGGRETGTAATTAGAATMAAGAAARSQQHQKHRRRRHTVIALCLVGVAVVAVLVAVFTTRKDNDNGSKNPREGDSTSMSPTIAPASAAPSVDPDVTAALDAILRTVPTDHTDTFNDSSSSSSSQSSSPQSRARTWMLETDGLRDSLLLGSNEERVKQRYALAVFYFGATNSSTADTDTRQSATTTNSDKSNSANASDSSVTTVNLSQDDAGWLQPDVSECEWTGMECHDSDTIDAMHLGASNLTGTLPLELAALTALREVDLRGNALTGFLPESVLLAWQDLFWMDLSENQFTGSIPGILWSQLQVLRYVYLHDNLLTGELEMIDNGNSSTSTNPFLEDVWLFNNLLVGPLPTWMVTLTSLQSWITFGNAMTGPLPDFGTAFTRYPLIVPQNLIFLDVSDNELTGTLPESLLTVPSATLRFLYLDRNQLRGPLPPGNHSAVLEEVWLHSNQFTGVVPETFSSEWTKLQELRLQDNNVTGVLRGADCSVNTLNVMTADCSNETLTGVPEVTCPCCTECF